MNLRKLMKTTKLDTYDNINSRINVSVLNQII